MNRRELIARLLQTGGTLCALTAGLTIVTQSQASTWVVRPPGALPEKDFLAHCSRCGQCVLACPYQTLKLASTSDAAALGTPFFEPRKVACHLCTDMPCIQACPTEALQKLNNINEARMGVAVIDPNSCLSWHGLRCEICLRVCPLPNKALYISAFPRAKSKHTIFAPIIDPNICTGCGLCEKDCPTDLASIRVQNPQTFRGAVGKHYRFADDRINETDQKPSFESDSNLDYLNGDV